MEWICSMLQVTAEILEEQAADKARDLRGAGD
jgi:hypothetical protein